MIALAEIWKDIPDYVGLYQASSLGNIRNAKTGKVLARKPHRDFYAKVNLHTTIKCRTFHVHTLIALAFLGPRPVGHFIDHDDVDHTNDAASNLFYRTPHESSLNRQRRGNSRQYTGAPNVYYHGRGGYFARCYGVDGKQHRLGRFDDKAAAIEAVKKFKESTFVNRDAVAT